VSDFKDGINDWRQILIEAQTKQICCVYVLRMSFLLTVSHLWFSVFATFRKYSSIPSIWYDGERQLIIEWQQQHGFVLLNKIKLDFTPNE
jgi:hypothetical protein